MNLYSIAASNGRLTEENAALFAETADLKEKLLDTQVELNAAIDYINEIVNAEAAEPDQVIHVHHFIHDHGGEV